jgi:hypothetical protein
MARGTLGLSYADGRRMALQLIRDALHGFRARGGEMALPTDFARGFESVVAELVPLVEARLAEAERAVAAELGLSREVQP